MSIRQRSFGSFPAGEATLYTLENRSGASVSLLDYGGIVQSVCVPDKNGVLADVVCGFDTPEGYLAGEGYHGAIIGRYGNRIENGRFSLNGKTYSLALNEKGICHLHGGDSGFNQKLWNAETRELPDRDSVILSRLSPDGEEGYPGNLSVRVTYTFDDRNALSVRYEAVCDADTVLNLTNHTYFNLSGYDGSSVMEQLLQINAKYYCDVDSRLIPKGQPKSVAETSFDYTALRKISEPLDHNFVLDGGRTAVPRPAALYCDPVSRRTVAVLTDLPGIQIYTAGGMTAPVHFKGGVPQRPLHAIAMETQFFPNSPNRPDFPSCVLPAAVPFMSETVYRFGIQEEGSAYGT